jgi:hypothetical protein
MEKEFTYDLTHNEFVSKEEVSRKIKINTQMRYKLEQIKYDKAAYVIILKH